MTRSELSLDLWPANPIYLPGGFRLSSVFLPFIIGWKFENLNILKHTLACVQRDVGLCRERDVASHWPCDQVYGSCCQVVTFLGETVCRYAVHALHTESLSKEKRQSSPFGHEWLSSVYPSVFLPGPVFCTLPPFTLPFLFRFSSGAASLEVLLFGLPFTLPFLFRFSSGTMCFSRMWIPGTLWYQVWVLVAEASLPYIGV